MSQHAANNNYHLGGSSVSEATTGASSRGTADPPENGERGSLPEKPGKGGKSKGAVHQMPQTSRVSKPSQAAVTVMDSLLADVENRRRSRISRIKHKASSLSPEGQDELQSAVKKLIPQAGMVADSATQSLSRRTLTSNVRQSVSQQQRPAIDKSDLDEYPPPRGMSAPNSSFDHALQAAGITAMDGQRGEGSANADELQLPRCTHPQLWPFTFPVDPTSSTTFPPLPAFHHPQTPHLDPEVQSILASYVPQNSSPGGQGVAGSAAAPRAPDDFSSWLSSFRWENSN
ncbi:hypothetical protein JCM24511_02083 [Saitozyma sp. JCM 24511]|nr:hypothetical protein JCM24511_02083 [Saitozyma sp. JCM 24511]